MTSASYEIIVDTSRALTNVKSLETALIALGSGAAVNEIMKMSDSITQMTNRLGQVAQAGQDTSAMFNTLAAEANKMGAPISAVGDLFYKLAVNTRDVNISQKELLGMTTTLYKELRLTGDSALGASSAILQLSQAFAKGRPDAMEMRSVLEHMPDVAKAMSDRLGVTSGVLRLMASDGKISAETLKTAIEDAASVIEDKFGKSTFTLEQGITEIDNAFTIMTAQFNKNTGAAQALTVVFLDLAIGLTKVGNFFKEWGGTILNVIEAVILLYAPLRLIRMAFVAIGETVTLVTGIFRGAAGGFNQVSAAASGSASVFYKAYNAIAQGANVAGQAISRVLHIPSGPSTVLGQLYVLGQQLVKIAALAGATIAGFLGFEKLKDYFTGITTENDKMKDAIKGTGDATGKTTEEQKKLAKELDPVQKRVKELNEALGITETEMDNAGKKTDLMSTAQYKLQKSADDATKALEKQFRAMDQSLKTDIQLIGLGPEQQDRVKADLDRLNKYEEAVKKLKDDAKKQELPMDDKYVVAGLENLKKAYDESQATADKDIETKHRLTRANEQVKFSLAELYKQTDAINQINREAAKVGLPLVTQQYMDIKAAADDAADAQLRSIAAQRGITVEQIPQSDRQAVIDATTASIQKQMAAQEALNAKIAQNDIVQSVNRHRLDQAKEIRKLQDDINKTTLSDTAKAYYDIGAAADEAAKAEIRLAAEKQGIKPEDLPIEQVKAYYEANFQGIDQLIAKTRELQAAQEAQMAVAFATKEKTAAAAKLQQIQDETAKLGMTEIEKKYYDIEAAAKASAEAELAAVAARQGIDRSQLDAATVEKYYKAATAGTTELKNATAQGYAQSRTFATGWKQALNTYTEDATNAANQAGRLFKTTTQGMEDMIVKFAKTGKFEWKSFLATVVEELLRSQIVVLLSNILNGGKSSGGSGNGLISGIADMFGLGGDTGIGGAISSALGGGGGGTSSGSGVLGTARNPMYVIVAGSQAGSTMNQTAKKGGNIASDLINSVIKKPAVSGTSWIDDIGDGISNFFTGNSGASSDDSSYGILQSNQNRGTSIFDDIGSAISSLWSDDEEEDDGSIWDWFTKNATGGNIPAGRVGIVGEQGPEFVRGPVQVTTTSQSQADGLLGGPTNVTYNINAVDAASFKAMIAADPSFIYAVSMQGARGIPKR